MFNFFRQWLNQRVIKRSIITVKQWEQAFVSLPLLIGLTMEEKKDLQQLAILFIHYKIFNGAQGLVVTLEMKLIIALQACLPILALGLNSYSGWLSIIVYPSGFAPERTVMDENGVVHYIKSNLAGEAWQRGPVILAWDETKFAGIIDGSNLVIHEFAHKLDMQNGVANGFPPLHSTMSKERWVQVFSRAYENFQQQCEAGIFIGIDCYAASSPAEFFAVLSEVFFERPDIIKQHYVAVHDLLELYYKQVPLQRLN